jgi:hypothetical protein
LAASTPGYSAALVLYRKLGGGQFGTDLTMSTFELTEEA